MKGALPNHVYEFDVFASAACDAGGVGPAEVLLGSGTAETNGAGEVRAEFDGRPLAGIDAESFTVTTTEAATGTTSQISTCVGVPPTTTIDSAPPDSTSSTATFTFSGSDTGRVAGFQCSLDGAAFTPCTSPQTFSGLAPGTHTFAVRATDAAGNAGDPAVYRWTVAAKEEPKAEASTVTTPPPPAGPTPVNGEKVVVVPVAGKVQIKLPKTNKYVPLKELKEIPVGAVIDARKGKVHLVSIDPDGTEQSADFFGGVFRVKQRTGAGLVVLELIDTGVCPAPSKRSLGAPRAFASGLALRPAGGGAKGKLWGSGHGNFTTEGNDGSATVRGTIWLVEDRCDGTTFFKTRRGVVSVRDFIAHKTLPLPAGRTYVAGEG